MEVPGSTFTFPRGGTTLFKAFLHLLLNAGIFLFLSHPTSPAGRNVLPGFFMEGWGSAILASFVLGLVNATFGLVLKILTFPLILLTFGLFSFVVNAVVILVVSFLVPGFHISGFLPALIAAVILSVVNLIWRMATAERAE
jgi:putative membrane protein